MPGVPSDADLVESNMDGDCWLPGPETDPGSYPREQGSWLKGQAQHRGVLQAPARLK